MCFPHTDSLGARGHRCTSARSPPAPPASPSPPLTSTEHCVPGILLSALHQLPHWIHTTAQRVVLLLFSCCPDLPPIYPLSSNEEIGAWRGRETCPTPLANMLALFSCFSNSHSVEPEHELPPVPGTTSHLSTQAFWPPLLAPTLFSFSHLKWLKTVTEHDSPQRHK